MDGVKSRIDDKEVEAACDCCLNAWAPLLVPAVTSWSFGAFSVNDLSLAVNWIFKLEDLLPFLFVWFPVSWWSLVDLRVGLPVDFSLLERYIRTILETLTLWTYSIKRIILIASFCGMLITFAPGDRNEA